MVKCNGKAKGHMKVWALLNGFRKRACKTANDHITSSGNSSTNESPLKTYKGTRVGKHTLSP